MLCLSDDVIIEVAAAALWTKLESLYMRKFLTNKLLLKQRLFRLRMQEGMPLRDHLENLNKILLDLRNVDVIVEDKDAALILLVSLPESYENSVESFMTGKETLSLEDVRSALHIRDDRQQATQRIKKKLGKKKDANSSATVAEADDANSEEELALVADEQPHCNDVWILDSGASVVCKVVGIGSIKIRTHDGVFCTLNDVKHVPQMTKNLISLSTLDSKGLSFKGESGVMRILKGSKVVLTAQKRGTLYVLRGSIVANSADIASSEVATKDMTKLWHMRLGHMRERGMRIMSNRDFLSGHKVQKLDFCEHCVFGKLHRNNVVEDLEGVDKQVELQVTHDESESQLQGGEDQHTTAEVTTDTTNSDVHPEARQRSIAIDRARRTGVKPPLKYGFEGMMAYALQVASSPVQGYSPAL
ncbi:hypothetical protein SASPL_108654 [Salvia splendens]|uniref:GAG-pre-integrase domain-containing protein n=1 Tax=Salvia splendens TaxID=180675 RepID=A0A8X8YFP4_SALSN|nr:hypothetical protein SASPL_108654 [Salvia splendens]